MTGHAGQLAVAVIDTQVDKVAVLIKLVRKNHFMFYGLLRHNYILLCSEAEWRK